MATQTMVDFHHSTTSRPTTEETLLSLYAHDSDATNAELIRLYRSIEFPGRALLQTEGQQQRQHAHAAAETHQLPRVRHLLGDDERVFLHSFPLFYGYRPCDPWAFHLSAWEFLMWWEVIAKKK